MTNQPPIIIMRDGDDVTVGHHGNPVAHRIFDTDEEADAYVAGVRDVAETMGVPVADA